MARMALAEMVQELRRELQSAVEAGDNEDIRFQLGEVTLEVEVEVVKEGGGETKFSFWIAEVGASGSAAETTTQKITLMLQPRDRSGRQINLRRPDRG